MTALNNRYDFVFLFDVKDGNPNGDPDAGNLPRVDPETGLGLVTDVCLKRKVRNYVGIVKGENSPYDIFVKERTVLNQQIERAYTESDVVREGVAAWERWNKDKKNSPKPLRHYEDLAQDWMCHNFFDVRTFGAVMSTGDNKDSDSGNSKLRMRAGQVRGPVQLTFGRSVDPVVAFEHTITRMAVTNEKDLGKERTMGRKFTVPYGLYVAHGFVSPHLAAKTGFSEEDLALLWEALVNCFEHDRSAARGEMATRGLYVFKHTDGHGLGCAPAQKLFACVQPSRKEHITVPRSFEDYTVEVRREHLAPGVELHVLAAD